MALARRNRRRALRSTLARLRKDKAPTPAIALAALS